MTDFVVVDPIAARAPLLVPLNWLRGSSPQLSLGQGMEVERQNGVDLQFKSLQIIDQVQLAADGKGQCWAGGRAMAPAVLRRSSLPWRQDLIAPSARISRASGKHHATSLVSSSSNAG